jgi:exopolyphosphatase/pppGpp-phosphohydrolase
MRLGVLDIGSNAAQLQIVGVSAGGPARCLHMR